MGYQNFTALCGNFESDWFVALKYMVILYLFYVLRFFLTCFIIGSWGHTFVGKGNPQNPRTQISHKQ